MPQFRMSPFGMSQLRCALTTAALSAVAVVGLTACNPNVGAGALTTSHHSATSASASSTTTATSTAVTDPVTDSDDPTVTATSTDAGATSETTDPATSTSAAIDPTADPATTDPTMAVTTTSVTTEPVTTSPTPSATAAPVVTTSKPPTRTPSPTPMPTSTPPADSSVAAQVLARVNAERAKAGCQPVTLDARLTAAAAGHSADMADHDYFSHTSQDGRTFVDRILATGYPSPRSENIAAGQPTPTAVMDAWMGSAGHRANILDCTATQMGVASARGGSYGIYWTQDFGTA